MDLDKLLSEMNIEADQRSYAMAQAGLPNRPTVSMEQIQSDLLKNVLGHVYKPNEFSIGINGNTADVTVGNQNFTGPFDKVLKSCVEFVVKPQTKK